MVGFCVVFFFQAEDGIRDLVRSRGLGDVYKRQILARRVLQNRGQGMQAAFERLFCWRLGEGVSGVTRRGKGSPAAKKRVEKGQTEGVSRFSGRAEATPGERAGVCAASGRSGRWVESCLLYTSPSPRDRTRSRMPSSACK